MKTLQDELINAEVLPQDFGFKPTTDLKTGLGAFAKWYKEYYKI